MNILITGLHGFVGSNLVRALAPRHTIYGVDIIAPEKEGVVRTFSWEDLDRGGIPEVDVVIHLAGKAHDTKNETEADVYFKVNTGLTERIFDWFLRSGMGKFIFFSTAKAAADRVDGVLTEEVVPAPVGPYGESKIAAEKYILSGVDGLKEEQRYYILRPCMIHGPGNKGNLNLLYNVVSKGIPWPLGAFDNKRTFTSIGNLSFIIDALIDKDIPSGIYNVGDDEPLSTNELIELICRTLGKRPRIWHLSRGLMTFCAKVGTVLHLPLNEERLRKLTENYVSSNEKIKLAIGVGRLPVDARDGIVKTIESFRK